MKNKNKGRKKMKRNTNMLNAAFVMLIVTLMVIPVTTAVAVDSSTFGTMDKMVPVKPQQVERTAG